MYEESGLVRFDKMIFRKRIAIANLDSIRCRQSIVPALQKMYPVARFLAIARSNNHIRIPFPTWPFEPHRPGLRDWLTVHHRGQPEVVSCGRGKSMYMHGLPSLPLRLDGGETQPRRGRSDSLFPCPRLHPGSFKSSCLGRLIVLDGSAIPVTFPQIRLPDATFPPLSQGSQTKFV